MANKSQRFSDNIPGPYYVDQQCISCSACVTESPDCFAMNEESGHAFVKKQPGSDQDLASCENARSICPVEAIGNDG
jgi:ferredoxin